MRPDLPDHHAYRAHGPNSQQHIDKPARRMQDEHFPVRGPAGPADKHIQPVRQQPEHRTHAGGNPPAQPRHHRHQEHIVDAHFQKHAQQQPQCKLCSHLRAADHRAENRVDQHQQRQVIAAAGGQKTRALMRFSSRLVCQFPFGAVPDEPRESQPADQAEHQTDRHCHTHSVPSRRSSRSSSSSSAVKPLAHSAAANAGRLPPQSVS